MAGGRSSRMGQDKATLVIEGKPLWQRQLDTLRAIAPAELIISGRPEGPYADCGVRILPDEQPGLGPLGGLATVLRAARHPLVLVLAVDQPGITPEWLTGLLSVAPAIPFLSGKLEPLAAVYPKSAATVAARLLSEQRLAMRDFAEILLAAGEAQPLVVAADDAPLFRNLNTPEDVRALEAERRERHAT